MKTPPIYYIEWLDAVADLGWENVTDTVGNAHICYTVGYLVKETDTTFTFATTFSPSDDSSPPQSNARMIIPKNWIKKKRRVKI